MKILIIASLLIAPMVVAAPIVEMQQVDMNTSAAFNYDVKNLETDIITIGGNPELAVGIKQYFNKEKGYLTNSEKDHWINLVKHSIEQLNIKSLGAVRGKEELINKLNYLIGELSKEYK